MAEEPVREEVEVVMEAVLLLWWVAEEAAAEVPVVALELPAYQRKENWGAGETFYQLVRAFCGAERPARPEGAPPSCNILGATSLGFHHRDDVREIRALLGTLGISVNVAAPLDASRSTSEPTAGRSSSRGSTISIASTSWRVTRAPSGRRHASGSPR